MKKLVKESLNSFEESGYTLESILAELQNEWKEFKVDVEIVEESDEPDNYGYDENEDGEPYVKYAAFSFSSSEDDEMDEKVSMLGLEVVIDGNGEAEGQWAYDASPIFSGDSRTLMSAPQPWPVADPQSVLDEIDSEHDDEE